MRRNSACSRFPRRRWLHAIADRSSVRRPVRSAIPSGARSSDEPSPSISSWAAGESVVTRAAASSIASGRPSRRSTSPATATALSAVHRKSASTAIARSQKSATAGACSRASGSVTSTGGVGRVPSRTTCSPRTRSGAAAVATRCVPGHSSRMSSRARIPSGTWSTSSTMTSVGSNWRLRRRASAGDCPETTVRSNAPATAATSRSGSSIEEQSAMTAPPGRSPPTRRAVSAARRVLPAPLRPVIVTRRASGERNRPTSDRTSASRPTNDVRAGPGRRRWSRPGGPSAPTPRVLTMPLPPVSPCARHVGGL